jgi:hypothetical protein
MGRVTTTAGEDPGGRGGAAGAPFAPGACGAGGAAALADDDCALDPLLFDGGLAPGIPRCVDFVAGAPFAGWALGCCVAPPPRPSFGGRCIDGPSSAALFGAASVSPFGPPEKSLEKTLIAEHQR